MEMEQFVIDEIKVYTLPLKPRLAFRLDRKLTALIFHTLTGEEEIDLEKFEEIEVTSLLSNFINSLERLTDPEYLDLALDLLSNTQIEIDKKTIQIVDLDSFDVAFSGVKIFTIYKILLKIMELNNFTPFVLAGELGLTGIMDNLSGIQT
jgi:hypothetical protein